MKRRLAIIITNIELVPRTLVDTDIAKRTEPITAKLVPIRLETENDRRVRPIVRAQNRRRNNVCKLKRKYCSSNDHWKTVWMKIYSLYPDLKNKSKLFLKFSYSFIWRIRVLEKMPNLEGFSKTDVIKES